jgi:hypothetical protein
VPIVCSIRGACARHGLRALAPSSASRSARGDCACRPGCLRPLFAAFVVPAHVIACRRGRLCPLFTVLVAPAFAGMVACTRYLQYLRCLCLSSLAGMSSCARYLHYQRCLRLQMWVPASAINSIRGPCACHIACRHVRLRPLLAAPTVPALAGVRGTCPKLL